MNPEPLENLNLPSYKVSKLGKESMILFKFIENFDGFEAGEIALLSFFLVRRLQQMGVAYYFEKPGSEK